MALNKVYGDYVGNTKEELCSWPPNLGGIEMPVSLRSQLDSFNDLCENPMHNKTYTLEAYFYEVAGRWFSVYWTPRFEKAIDKVELRQLLSEIRLIDGFPADGDGIFGALMTIAFAAALMRLAEG